MDPTTSLILTVTINALVTGVLIFYFQRRLESKLGRENFEHQTKFSDIYTKRVKTLEGLYQKFITFEISLSDFARHTRGRIGNYKEDYADMRGKSDDVRSFFENNRLFLSDHENKVLTDIFFNVSLTETTISEIAANPLIEVVPDDLIEFLPDFEEIEEYKDFDLKNPDQLLQRLTFEVLGWSSTIKRLYMSEIALKEWLLLVFLLHLTNQCRKHQIGDTLDLCPTFVSKRISLPKPSAMCWP